MDAAHGGHLIGDADGMIEREHNYFGWRGGDGVEDRGDVDGASGDFEFGAAAQGAGQELGLHAVGVGDQDGDGGGRGGWRRSHLGRAPNGAELRAVLILGVGGWGLKGTCHFIRVRLSNRESGLLCCGKTLMSQIGIGNFLEV